MWQIVWISTSIWDSTCKHHFTDLNDQRNAAIASENRTTAAREARNGRQSIDVIPPSLQVPSEELLPPSSSQQDSNIHPFTKDGIPSSAKWRSAAGARGAGAAWRTAIKWKEGSRMQGTRVWRVGEKDLKPLQWDKASCNPNQWVHIICIVWFSDISHIRQRQNPWSLAMPIRQWPLKKRSWMGCIINQLFLSPQ